MSKDQPGGESENSTNREDVRNSSTDHENPGEAGEQNTGPKGANTTCPEHAFAADEDTLIDDEVESIESFMNGEESSTESREQESNKENTFGTVRAEPQSSFDSSADLLPSKAKRLQSIGRYNVQSLLGQGSFGRVYKALDTQLDRLVAVKVSKMQPETGAIDRFLREARSAAHLRHPAIIPVYEYGQLDNMSMIVYQLIEGESLRTRIHRLQNIELEEVINTIRKIAEGLDYAHRQGIVHRDIKPENILLDRNGDPHIADFGCARRFDEQDLNSTLDGSMLGTPSYMSPEQAGGKANQADGRTDVWSLGVMLYEMVTGQRPFQGGFAELLDAIQNRDATPIRKLAPHVPRDIETICDRCLQRDLSQRFSSAGELAAELGRFQRGMPIKSRRIHVLTRTWLWSKRNPVIAMLLSAVVLILLGATTVSTYFWNEVVNEQHKRAQESLKVLTTADSAELNFLLSNLTLSSRDMEDEIFQQLQTEETAARKRRLLVGLNYLSSDLDVSYLSEIKQLIVDADAYEIIAFAKGFSDTEKETLATEFWKTIESESGFNDRERFAIICLLAQIDPGSQLWQTTTAAVDAAGYLVSVNLLEIRPWMSTLLPIQSTTDKFKMEISRYYLHGSAANRETAAIVFSILEESRPGNIVRQLLPHADSRQMYHILPLLCNQSNREQTLNAVVERIQDSDLDAVEKANLVIAQIHLNAEARDWQFQLRSGNCSDQDIDNTVGTEIIERLGPAGTDVETILGQISALAKVGSDLDTRYNQKRFECEDQWNALAVLILSLGQFDESQIPESRKVSLWENQFRLFFRNHPDARVHSSIAWLFNRWGLTANIIKAEKDLMRPLPDDGKNWHIDLLQNTFVVFSPGEKFTQGRNWPELSHHRFGICVHEVTNGQFGEFAKSTQFNQMQYGLETLPVTDVQCFWAMAYCQWLTEKTMHKEDSAFKIKQLEQNNYDLYQHLMEKIPKPIAAIDDRKDHQKDRIPNSWFDLKNPGYRLPTKSEWQFACRARSSTSRSFGNSDDKLGHYAWYTSNSGDRAHPVGQLKPNEAGLFDMLGNVAEWCLDVSPGGNRYYCGGHFHTYARNLNSETLFERAGVKIGKDLGFRLARSYPAENANQETENSTE